jgi:hypothetical protein
VGFLTALVLAMGIGVAINVAFAVGRLLTRSRMRSAVR